MLGVDFHWDQMHPDPKLQRGTKCGADKIIENFQCRCFVLNYDCDVQKSVHGHGVCNSNRIVCEMAWLPKLWVKGYGGSGQWDLHLQWNVTALKGWTSGILPNYPLLSVLFLFIKRSTVEELLQKKKYLQTYETDGKNQANPSRQSQWVFLVYTTSDLPEEVPICNRFQYHMRPASFSSSHPRPPPSLKDHSGKLNSCPFLLLSLLYWIPLDFFNVLQCLRGTEINTFPWRFLKSLFFLLKLWMKQNPQSDY